MPFLAHLILLFIIPTVPQVLSFLQTRRESICFHVSTWTYTKQPSNCRKFRMSPTTSSSTGLSAKPSIEVITKPDEAFLEKKG